MSDNAKTIRFVTRVVPSLILVSLVAWCTTNNHSRQQTMPVYTELRSLFMETGMIDSPNTADLSAVAERIGESGMNQLLYEAASGASLDAIKWIVKNGADPKNIGAIQDLTLLQRAAKIPRHDRLEYFLSLGLDPKERTRDGMTLLHIAAQNGVDQRTVALLVSAGLSVTDTDIAGRQPIHFASVKSIPVLVGAGADINAKDHDGRTPLHHAAAETKHDITSQLIQQGASVFAQDNQGRTPLHLAAMNNYSEQIVDTLLASGAPTTARDRDGNTPRDLAIDARENSRRYSASVIDKL